LFQVFSFHARDYHVMYAPFIHFGMLPFSGSEGPLQGLLGCGDSFILMQQNGPQRSHVKWGTKVQMCPSF